MNYQNQLMTMIKMAFVFPHYHFADVSKTIANTKLSRNFPKIPTGSLFGFSGNGLFMGIPP